MMLSRRGLRDLVREGGNSSGFKDQERLAIYASNITRSFLVDHGFAFLIKVQVLQPPAREPISS